MGLWCCAFVLFATSLNTVSGGFASSSPMGVQAVTSDPGIAWVNPEDLVWGPIVTALQLKRNEPGEATSQSLLVFFSFNESSIPVDEEILGIEMVIEVGLDDLVQGGFVPTLYINGSIEGTSLQTAWYTEDTQVRLGGESFLWSSNWTRDDIFNQNATFQFFVVCQAAGAKARINSVRMHVYFTSTADTSETTPTEPQSYTSSSVTSSREGGISPVLIVVVLLVAIVVLVAVGLLVFVVIRRKKGSEAQELALAESNYLTDVTIGDKLGGGKFGEVFKGTYQGADVALKKLKDNTKVDEFDAEVNALKSLHHPNIVRYLGIFKSDQDIFIVTEFLEDGSLDGVLERDSGIPIEQLVDMAIQVASGMKHLHEKSIVHRDLACRNLLATTNKHGRYTIKVGDFGLSRVVQNEDFYQIQTSAFPVKWSAPEVIKFGKCSTKSDVWAYGITLWEIFSFGAFPYPGCSNQETSDKVAEGYRMPSPDNCPSEVYQLMLQCWNVDPDERPSFDSIHDTLSKWACPNQSAVTSPQTQRDDCAELYQA